MIRVLNLALIKIKGPILYAVVLNRGGGRAIGRIRGMMALVGQRVRRIDESRAGERVAARTSGIEQRLGKVGEQTGVARYCGNPF